MTVEVLFFARLREVFGSARRLTGVPEGASVREIVRRLAAESGEDLEGGPLIFAVNEHFAGGDRPLRDQDVVAIMTPMSGG